MRHINNIMLTLVHIRLLILFLLYHTYESFLPTGKIARYYAIGKYYDTFRNNNIMYMASKNVTADQNFLTSLNAPGNSIEDWAERKASSTGIIPTSADSLVKLESATSNDFFRKKNLKNATKYFKIVDSLTPNEILMKFAQRAPKNVQEACKSTVVNILGSLPNYALDAALITTNTKLANLMYQMQMTGYMFKNAEYRMSLTRSLKGLPRLPPSTQVTMTGGNSNFTDAVNPLDQRSSTLSGDITVKSSVTGETVVVPVQDLTDALSREISDLRAELASIRNERETELKSNLLTYIQALPEKDLMKLTSDMSDEVVTSIQLLVDTLMERLGIDKSAPGPELIIQQSVGQLAQLCMWQMVVGYKLRELEALDKGASYE